MKLLLEQNWTKGNLPVSWCLDEKQEKELFEEKMLKSNNAECFAIIDVIPEGQSYSKNRQVVKFNQGRAYVTFDRARVNRIFIAIFTINQKFYGSEEVREKMLSRYLWGYSTMFLNTKEEPPSFDSFLEAVELISWTYKEVNVPEDYFAKEPPQWWKDYATILAPQSMKDQCDLRKWSLFAIFIQTPFIMPIMGVFGLIKGMIMFLMAFFLTLVMGYRDINWKPILHPFKNSFSDITEEAKKWRRGLDKEGNYHGRKVPFWDVRSRREVLRLSSVFSEDKEEKLRPWYIQILRPLISVPLILLGYFFGSNIWTFVSFLFENTTNLSVGINWVGVLYFTAITLVTIGVLKWLVKFKNDPERLRKKRTKEEQRQREEIEKMSAERKKNILEKKKKELERKKQIKKQLEAFACGSIEKKGSIEDIKPAETSQVIHLAYKKTKGGLCKPYQK